MCNIKIFPKKNIILLLIIMKTVELNINGFYFHIYVIINVTG